MLQSWSTIVLIYFYTNSFDLTSNKVYVLTTILRISVRFKKFYRFYIPHLNILLFWFSWKYFFILRFHNKWQTKWLSTLSVFYNMFQIPKLSLMISKDSYFAIRLFLILHYLIHYKLSIFLLLRSKVLLLPYTIYEKNLLLAQHFAVFINCLFWNIRNILHVYSF